MKKKLLFFVLSFAQLSIAQTSCIVDIPDANFKNALLNHSPAIDTNSDREIQCSEATAFRGLLNVSGKNISNLTGIEAFTNIARLYCYNNQLTSLNVSANTAMQYLYCDNNQLTSLDLSANTSLRYLECISNRLTSLNLSKNWGLKLLACTNNQLTSLNLANGNNTNFSYLYAGDNPNLTCIQVDNVTYSTANWTSTIGWTNLDFIIPAGAYWSENCSSLGISDFDTKTVQVYPNPTNGMVTISEHADVSVFDIQGKIISESKNTTSFDLSAQTTGMYFAKITTEKGTQTIKIVKK
ncbi:leucine-rich repeat domain-containing protein [Flavobacterium ajazii]|uniref:leucine-rich repeat domain-containing protein n=1 Tax=Flavobacterium ajazii TaxID=2692318 RepID=UPI0013D50077|nr:T9SS type A sorting domain-containing protein [Flavobacterium ajazii]